VHVELTGGQVVAFIAFCVLVGPGLILVGGLWQRVRQLEVDRDSANEQRAAMQECLDDVREKVALIHGRIFNGHGSHERR
jgi:hypothetical protein